MLKQKSSIILMIPVVAILLGNISGCSNLSGAEAKEASFVCSQLDNFPATVVKIKGSEIPILKWVTTEIDNYPPEKRCSEVSARFQTYYQAGSLKYITTGQMNNENAICTTNHKGGDCTDLLFTVKPGANPRNTLEKLIAIRTGEKGTVIIETDGRLYLNIDKLLESDVRKTSGSDVKKTSGKNGDLFDPKNH
jgi:Circadian oscillating protein COP23